MRKIRTCDQIGSILHTRRGMCSNAMVRFHLRMRQGVMRAMRIINIGLEEAGAWIDKPDPCEGSAEIITLASVKPHFADAHEGASMEFQHAYYVSRCYEKIFVSLYRIHQQRKTLSEPSYNHPDDFNSSLLLTAGTNYIISVRYQQP